MPLKLLTSLGLALAAMNFSTASADEPSVPFQRVAGHCLAVPVRVGSNETRFLFDTGAGVNIISQKIADRMNLKPDGNHGGKRMSGQPVHFKATHLPSLTFGNQSLDHTPAAIVDLEKMFAGEADLKNIEGIISLNFFRNIPFTIDYQRNCIILESKDTLQQRINTGFLVPIHVTTKGRIESDAFLPVSFSNGLKAIVEIDTGSGSLILNKAKYMERFGLSESASALKCVDGLDETGHKYQRYFGTLPANLSLGRKESTSYRVQQPKVQFQNIIYDGLIGDDCLSQFVVSCDLQHKRVIFNKP